MRRFLIPLLLCLFWLAAQPTNLSAQVQLAAGTRVSLIPPVGFIASPQFGGFTEASSGASIIVTEITGSYSRLVIVLSDPSALQKRGMTLLHKENVTQNSQSGLLLRVQQTTSGVEYLKWIFVFGTETDVVTVVAGFPASLDEELSAKLKASVLTAKRDAAHNASPTEGLTFGITEKGEFRIARRTINMLLYEKGGATAKADPDAPIFIAGSSLREVEITNQEQFARARVAQTATVTDIQVERLTPVTVDQLSGHEIVAKAKDKQSGKPLLIYQLILHEGKNYYLMQGIALSVSAEENLPLFKQMGLSFKRKK